MGAGRAEVISIAARGHRADYSRVACGQVAAARHRTGLDRAAFAGLVGGLLGWDVLPDHIAAWEDDSTPPGDVLLAAASAAEGGLIAPPGTLLGLVPHGFPAQALEGPWVTSYRFTHDGDLCYHADIAHVTAETERQIRAVNNPPEPRTQGRVLPFRNEIEARLAGRHLIGHWKNISDARYFGALHLAVLPGETVMEGWYTGLSSDIGVSCGPWRWARLDPSSLPDDAGAVKLREPEEVYGSVMKHSQYGALMALPQIGEEA